MTDLKRIECDCSCNGGLQPCNMTNHCRHLGCGWVISIELMAKQERQRIDSGATRSHKPPDNLNAPAKATLHSRVHVKLQNDRVIGKETITLEEYLRSLRNEST